VASVHSGIDVRDTKFRENEGVSSGWVMLDTEGMSSVVASRESA
jgi:hypothetical protein